MAAAPMAAIAGLALLAGTTAALAQAGGAAPAAPDAAKLARGEYVFHIAGCAACHSEEEGKGPALAGGVALKT